MMINIVLLAAGLFFGMLVLLETGRRIGLAKLLIDPYGMQRGTGAVDGAVFALLGLMIAFTFTGAAARFEERRHLITEEADAIGTAYLRLDLLTEESRPAMRELFRRYLDSRLDIYADVKNTAAVKKKLDYSTKLQGEIWGSALSSCFLPGVPQQTALILLPALNEMFDVATKRTAAAQNHPPDIIFILLAGLSLVSALLAGYGMVGSKTPNLLYMIVFAGVMSISVYLIMDFEYPRLGIIRINAADQLLIDLRNSIE